jgi:hypothetical protein
MMHGREKSGSVIVAMKPANKAEPSVASAAELVERRAGAKGNAGQQSTRVGHSTERACHKSRLVCGMTHLAECRSDLRWEPYAGKPHVRICAGGAR